MDFFKTAADSILGRILLSGASVNVLLVLLGSAVGLLFKKGISERVKTALINGMALCVLYIGVTGLFEDGTSIIVIIISFALGAVIGELIDLDRHINRLGEKLEAVFSKGSDSKIAEGFVTSALLFCVGAMTVVGSVESGISGDNSTLYSKSVIDCITAAALASSLGAGVILSAVPVLVIEGGLTLLAALVSPWLTEAGIANMSAAGSLLIIALALNMLKITKIKVMNYLPAMLLPLIFCIFI